MNIQHWHRAAGIRQCALAGRWAVSLCGAAVPSHGVMGTAPCRSSRTCSTPQPPSWCQAGGHPLRCPRCLGPACKCRKICTGKPHDLAVVIVSPAHNTKDSIADLSSSGLLVCLQYRPVTFPGKRGKPGTQPLNSVLSRVARGGADSFFCPSTHRSNRYPTVDVAAAVQRVEDRRSICTSRKCAHAFNPLPPCSCKG